jgi:signal transduction histidine kinase
LFISGVRFVFNSFFFDVPGPLYYPYVVLWFSIVIYTQILLLRFFLNSTGRLRTQILYFIMGQIFGFSGGITNFFPTFGIEFYPFGNFTIPIYCLVITYAILRYRLMDISIAITRTGIFIAVYSLILGIPFIVASAFRLRLTGYLGDKWWWVPMGLLTVLATVGPFIYIFIEKKAEEALLKEQRQYQNTLRQASSGMIRVRELKRLLNLIVHVVTRAVRLEFAAIYLFDADRTQYKMAAKRDSSKFSQDHTIDMDSPLIDRLQQIREPLVYEEVQLQSQDNPRDLIIKSLEQQLKEIKASVVIPSYVGNRMLGFIVLGKKKTGKIFTQDDLNVFSVLANQAALAIENAQFYEDIKETQEQLFQAEKMATIGTMADGLSHQINNRFQALSLISGDSLDILKTTDIANCSEGVKDAFSQLKYAFERVQSNVKQGGEIVRGLLKYSRPGETGFEFVEFNRIIDGALEMAQYKVRLNELNIIRNFPAGLPKIKCNLTQLEEIFFNMVDNAYDAIKERQALNQETKIQGEIKISAQAEDGNMRIIFEDNGIGVKDKDKEKLFTPFFTTKSTNRKGTGLGLYVIQKIVGFHEGTITIDSTYNKGTTFDILLPISQGK